MLKLIAPLISLTVGIGLIVASPIVLPETAQAQTQKQKSTYKEQFDQRIKFADEHCVMKKRKVKNLTYEICYIEDLVMKVVMEGPPWGGNGPTAYFYSGRLYAFQDTDVGQAQIFQDGKLIAQVEVGPMLPEYNKTTTKFTPKVRKELTDRAISSTRDMLKVFGEKIDL
jgi:hypothetical protein